MDVLHNMKEIIINKNKKLKNKYKNTMKYIFWMRRELINTKKNKAKICNAKQSKKKNKVST